MLWNQIAIKDIFFFLSVIHCNQMLDPTTRLSWTHHKCEGK